MSSVSDRPTGQAYWRSLGEYADTPEFRAFMHREFPAGAAEMIDSGERRDFLKIMGASLALAGFGLTGCRRWPDEKIAPYSQRPVGQDPGVAQHFATTMEIDGIGSGLLVTSFDGRPTKVEGNPEHPVNQGRTNVLDQASVLDLYDPDRSQWVTGEGERRTWDDFVTWADAHFGALRDARGDGLRILCETTSSPSVMAMRRAIEAACPNARWYEYSPISDDNVVEGCRLAFGTPQRPAYRLDLAKIVLSFDADLLGDQPLDLNHARQLAAGRRRGEAHPSDMSRIYAVESPLTLTGAYADERVAPRSTDIGIVATWLAARLLNDQALRTIEEDPRVKAVVNGPLKNLLERAADDLDHHHGACVVVAGRNQPPEVHRIVHHLNAALENVGKTVAYSTVDSTSKVEQITSLCSDIDAGSVETLVIIGGNPVYDAPADLDFASKLASVSTVVHLSDYRNETSEMAAWQVNRAHYLEAWGDARANDGTIGITQPLIRPLFDGKSAAELLAIVVGDELRDGYDIVRRTFAQLTGDTFDMASRSLVDEKSWRRVLHAGFIAGSSYPTETPRIGGSTLMASVERLLDVESGNEVVFVADSKVYDGRFANNGWLQELPDPISKLTWDNAVQMSPLMAEELGVHQGDVVAVSAGGRTVEGPVLLVPGQHPQSVTLALGYGRAFDGRVSQGAGFNAYAMRTSGAMAIATGASITSVGGTYPLATTQDHHAIDVEKIGGRGQQRRLPTIFREANVSEYEDHPDFAAHRTHVTHRLSLWEEDLPHQLQAREPGRFRWGMSIDLNSCVGCNACVIACQAENNIPIVGKDQVLRGREMHWIRIDRYYRFKKSGDGGWLPNEVQNVAMMPVPCMQCENAPCEQVCPVAATVHDADGLNVMVYNRCVGTRYCSNNCPYKVRRFNYFDYHRRKPLRKQPGLLQVDLDYYKKKQAESNPLQEMQFNPEVTVRMRGVMEKCTFCVQRISEARIKAKNEWVGDAEGERSERVTIPDGSFTTACAQACPADAIVFGDLDDPTSEITDRHQSPLSYELLEELNTKPRTRYLAKLRNGVSSTHGESDGGHG